MSTWYSSFGHFYGRISEFHCDILAEGDGYVPGDAITVRLNLNTNTVAFRKNTEKVGPPQKLDDDAAYQFAFDGYTAGDAVTIIEAETM